VIVVSNTTPLSELAKVEQMHLLRDVFGEVIIPQEVYDELTRGIHPAATAVRSATWISVYSVNEDEKILSSKLIQVLTWVKLPRLS